jgi:hypothetical protein
VGLWWLFLFMQKSHHIYRYLKTEYGTLIHCW